MNKPYNERNRKENKNMAGIKGKQWKNKKRKENKVMLKELIYKIYKRSYKIRMEELEDAWCFSKTKEEGNKIRKEMEKMYNEMDKMIDWTYA